MESSSINELVGAELVFKCENLQKVGAFKARGAMNAVLQLPATVSHVVTHSSGNHGAALAWAAAKSGKQCSVIAPSDTARFKKDAMRRYGATIVECGPLLSDREDALARFVEETEAHFIPPYDDFNIICGQGTATLELLSDACNLNQVWTPVGGGGLAAGATVAADGRVPIFAAEPELAKDAYDSMRLGQRQPPYEPRTVADGLRTGLGQLNFEILRNAKVEIVLAPEDGIVDAMRILWTRLKTVVEPSAAVCLAAMLANPGRAKGRVGVILSGGNVEPKL